MQHTIHIIRPCPELGLHAGNFLSYDDETASPDCPLFLHRPYPANLAPILHMLETGAAEFITPHSTVSALAAAVGSDAGLPGSPRSVSPPLRHRHLRLE